MSRKKPFRVAVFASGQGSNFQEIADLTAAGKLDIQLELLVCDKPGAPVTERAKRAGVPVYEFRPKEYPSREAYEAAILQVLQKKEIDLIVLAGYMRLLTKVLVEPYYGRMINIHPSLLPAFPGIDAVGQAIAYRVRITGVTVHFVDLGLDSGPILLQKAVEIQDDDTVDSLMERVHAAERELLPEAIRLLREGRIQLEGRNVRILDI